MDCHGCGVLRDPSLKEDKVSSVKWADVPDSTTNTRGRPRVDLGMLAGMRTLSLSLSRTEAKGMERIIITKEP